jgi:hypothetical protein
VVDDEWEKIVMKDSALMPLFYLKDIPVRMGIGRGSFSRFAFTSIMDPSGKLFTEAPFLGTSIVRAYRCQDKKPGLRRTRIARMKLTS